MDFNLSNFSKYRENNRLEVKAANGGLPGSLWDSYSSFANSYGGCIICGVKERSDGSWKTTGLQNLSKLKKNFWDTIHNKNKVSNCLITEKNTEEYTLNNGDVILVIKVPAAARSQKPIFLNNDMLHGTWRRDHEGDYLCTEAEVKEMVRDSFEESSDMQAADVTVRGRAITLQEAFNRETVKSYRVRYDIRHKDSAWSELNDEDFLVQIGAADDHGTELRPTIAGLLMFGTERRITRIYPEYFLDYRAHEYSLD